MFLPVITVSASKRAFQLPLVPSSGDQLVKWSTGASRWRLRTMMSLPVLTVRNTPSSRASRPTPTSVVLLGTVSWICAFSLFEPVWRSCRCCLQWSKRVSDQAAPSSPKQDMYLPRSYPGA